jgi:hypothetical protein
VKKIALTILAFLILFGTAFSAERTTVTKDSAGTMSHVTAYVTESGITVWEVTPAGVSVYATTYNNIGFLSGVSGQIGVYSATGKVYGTEKISGASIYGVFLSSQLPDPVENGVSAIGKSISGKVFRVNLTSSETLNGNSIWGTTVGNWGAHGGVTATLPHALPGMSTFIRLTQGQAYGNTIFVVGDIADAFIGLNSNFSTGNSVVVLTGATLAPYVALDCDIEGYWHVTGVSGITYRNR